jgi:hypothetical protein
LRSWEESARFLLFKVPVEFFGGKLGCDPGGGEIWQQSGGIYCRLAYPGGDRPIFHRDDRRPDGLDDPQPGLDFIRYSCLGFSLGAFLVLLLGCYLVLEKFLRIGSAETVSLFYTPGQTLFRALFSGFIVTLAVFLGKSGGPVWGGGFSSFPAVFVSTLAITAKSAGVELSRTLTKSMLVSVLFNVVVYPMAARAFYPSHGLVGGAARERAARGF